jgi:hypothetical protein
MTRIAVTLAMAIALPAAAQHDHAAMEHAMAATPDSIGALHMEMTPLRKATRADSEKALAVVKELRAAIAKYADTTAAVRDGFRMFAPQMKAQKTYHFTRNRNAIMSVFRFDPSKPTSLLYERDSTGKLKLVGAMYTMPRGTSEDRLNDRIPLSIAQWHMHVDWCVPGRNHQDRWLEKKGGRPVFGPQSPIVTKTDCENVGGEFRESVFGWMVHVNVFAGDDLATIFNGHAQKH